VAPAFNRGFFVVHICIAEYVRVVYRTKAFLVRGGKVWGGWSVCEGMAGLGAYACGLSFDDFEHGNDVPDAGSGVGRHIGVLADVV
jgi:hypothetical protein